METLNEVYVRTAMGEWKIIAMRQGENIGESHIRLRPEREKKNIRKNRNWVILLICKWCEWFSNETSPLAKEDTIYNQCILSFNHHLIVSTFVLKFAKLLSKLCFNLIAIKDFRCKDSFPRWIGGEWEKQEQRREIVWRIPLESCPARSNNRF